MTMPASSAAAAARYMDPRLVEISLCAKSMVLVPPGRRSLDERDDAGRQGRGITGLDAAAEGVRGDVLDEVAPDAALLHREGRRVVRGALRAGPAGHVERREVGDGVG